MSPVAESMKTQLGELSIEDRFELATFWLESHASNDLGPEWDAELDSRFAEITGGTVAGISAQNALSELRKRFA